MTYPTDPTQVGLTVPKSELVFYDTANGRTLQTDGATYERQIFRGTTLIFEVDDLTFTDCWFYATSRFWLVYGAGNPQNIRFINCEFGLSSTDSTVYDPDGFQGTCSDKGLGLMQWKAYDCYSHHQADGHYVGTGTLVDHCFMHDNVYTGTPGAITVHRDVLQFTGQDDVSITRSYLADVLAADNVLVPSGGPGDNGNPNAAVFIQAQQGPCDNVEVSDCYLDGEGWFTLRTSAPVYDVSNIRWLRNRFGRSFIQPGGGPVLVDAKTTGLVRYDNRYADTLELIDGDPPVTGPILDSMLSSERFTRSTNSAVTSGTSQFGPTVTADGTPHTKGAWAALLPASTFDSWMIAINTMDFTSNGVDTSTLVDIGVDPAGGTSYTVAVPNLLAGNNNSDQGRTTILPIFIPAGSTVAARAQSVVGGQAGRVGCTIYGGTHPNQPRLHRSVLTAYGPDVATSGGVAASSPGATNTKGTWTLIGTASRNHEGLVVATQGANSTTSAFYGLFDIGMDPAGGSSYTVIIKDVFVRGVSTERIYIIDPLSAMVARPIPSGATIAVRGQSTVADGVSTLDFAVYAF